MKNKSTVSETESKNLKTSENQGEVKFNNQGMKDMIKSTIT